MNRLVCAPRPLQIVSCWANFLGGVFPLLSAHYGFNPAVTSAPLMVRSWAAYTCLQQQLLRLCLPLLLAPLRPRLHLRPPVTAAAAAADCRSSHLSGNPAVCLPPLPRCRQQLWTAAASQSTSGLPKSSWASNARQQRARFTRTAGLFAN